MRTQGNLAMTMGLHVAVAVQAGACVPAQQGLPCDDELCPNGDLCVSVVTTVSVQSRCTAAGEWGALETSSKCLEALPAEGGMRLMTCNGDDSQVWAFTSEGSMVNAVNGLCLGVDSAQMNESRALVRLYPCSGDPNQIWRDVDGFIQLSNRMCLDVQSDPPYPDDTPVEIYPCDVPGSQDVWTFMSPGGHSAT